MIHTTHAVEDKNNDYSYWLMLLFGPFYLAFKGYLKEAIAVLLFSLLAGILIVDYLIDPENPNLNIYLSQLVSILINFVVTLKWSDYSKKNVRTFSRTVSFISLLMAFLTFVIGHSLIEQHFDGKKFQEAYSLNKEGKSSDALGIYFKLCRKDLGEACLNAGYILADNGMKDQSAKFLKKACKLEIKDGCNE